MSPFDEGLPPLDCHAHIAPDITAAQARGLEGATVFAVTRSLAEGAYAVDHGDPALVWGVGVHPGDPEALASFEPARFAALASRVALIGEVGLDGRKGDAARQGAVFAEILRIATAKPVLVSIHSASAIAATLEALEAMTPAGTLLHWFLGDAAQVKRAVAIGAYFSVPGAMADERIALLPRERVVPETDFSSGGRQSGRRPGDTAGLEARLAALWGVSAEAARHQLWRNLRRIASSSGAAERLPERVQDFLLMA